MQRSQLYRMLLAIAAGSVCQPAAAAADLPLATDGRTDYQIVTPDSSSAVDRYAVDQLGKYLKEMTGAVFPVVAPGGMAADKHSIFVGISGPARRHLGPDALAQLQDQEHVACTIGQDIFLYGKGIHGNLHAVMEFLEGSLGWRWYSAFEKPVVPARSTVTLKPFCRRRGFSFRSREVGLRHNQDFYYQNGINMGSERWGTRSDPMYVSYLRNDKFVHSSFAYIPPSPEVVYARTFPWLKRSDYFATNPDFFSLNAAGKRVPSMQLCFSNPALRRELTRNILQHIAVAPGNDIITLDAADAPDAFCYCPQCKALEEKYRSPGGPIYDYLLELCGLLKKEHPRLFVKTLACHRRRCSLRGPVSRALDPSALRNAPDQTSRGLRPADDRPSWRWPPPDRPRGRQRHFDECG